VEYLIRPVGLRHVSAGVDSRSWQRTMLEDPEFFKDKRNLSVVLCADGIEKFKDKLGSVTPITCQVVNYPAHLRGKSEFIVLWGIIDGKPKDAQLFYHKFVDEIIDIEKNGCRVWDVIENKPFTVRVKLYKVLEDYVGLTEAGNVYGTNARMGCSKCWIVGTTKAESCMQKTIYAQMLQQNPSKSDPCCILPSMYSDGWTDFKIFLTVLPAVGNPGSGRSDHYRENMERSKLVIPHARNPCTPRPDLCTRGFTQYSFNCIVFFMMFAGEEPAMRTDKEVRELQHLHDGMIEAGMHPEVIKDKMARSGIKGSSAFTKIVKFNLPRDLLFDVMHILSNNSCRILAAILGDDWNLKCRNFARAYQMHRPWLIPIPRRNENDNRSPAERLRCEYTTCPI
jgi:hypothetical protein